MRVNVGSVDIDGYFISVIRVQLNERDAGVTCICDLECCRRAIGGGADANAVVGCFGKNKVGFRITLDTEVAINAVFVNDDRRNNSICNIFTTDGK